MNKSTVWTPARGASHHSRCSTGCARLRSRAAPGIPDRAPPHDLRLDNPGAPRPSASPATPAAPPAATAEPRGARQRRRRRAPRPAGLPHITLTGRDRIASRSPTPTRPPRLPRARHDAGRCGLTQFSARPRHSPHDEHRRKRVLRLELSVGGSLARWRCTASREPRRSPSSASCDVGGAECPWPPAPTADRRTTQRRTERAVAGPGRSCVRSSHARCGTPASG